MRNSECGMAEPMQSTAVPAWSQFAARCRKQLQEVLAVPLQLVRRYAPGLDERAWTAVAVLGASMLLMLKEVRFSTAEVVVLGVLVIGALRLLREDDPIMPFYWLVAYLPFSRVLGAPEGEQVAALNLPNVLAVTSVLLHLRRQRRAGGPLAESGPLSWVLLVFMAGCSLLMLRSMWLYGDWYAQAFLWPYLRWLKVFGFLFLSFWVVRDQRTLKTTAVLMMLGVCAVVLLGLWEYLDKAGDSFERSRIRVIAEEPNVLGAFYVSYMFLFAAAFLTAPRRGYGWLGLGALALAARAMLATFSRGACVAFVIAGLVACWFRHRVLFALAAAATVFVMANPQWLPDGVRYRFGMTLRKPPMQAAVGQAEDLAARLEPSAGNRVYIWRGAVAMIREHPWWGVGYGVFHRFIPHYTSDHTGYRDAHNQFLLYAAEFGVPLTALFILVLLVAGVQGQWLYVHAVDPVIRTTALGLLAGLAGMATANLFTSSMGPEEVTGYFWILAGLIMRGVVIEKHALSGAGGVRQGAMA